ncbi:MAG: hypothetical protein LAT65_13670 [Saccharospirillum sp.]|nr:hypothetical protein [Saccharospirillum sp.]
MKKFKITTATLLASILVLALSSCDRDGPAEQAGERIDDAMEDAGEAIEDMRDSIDDTFDNSRDNTFDNAPGDTTENY